MSKLAKRITQQGQNVPTWTRHAPVQVASSSTPNIIAAGTALLGVGYLVIVVWLFCAKLIPEYGWFMALIYGMKPLSIIAMLFWALGRTLLVIWLNLLRGLFEKPGEYSLSARASHSLQPAVASLLVQDFLSSAPSSHQQQLQSIWQQARWHDIQCSANRVNAKLTLQYNINAPYGKWARKLLRSAHIIATITSNPNEVQCYWKLLTYGEPPVELVNLVDSVQREITAKLNSRAAKLLQDTMIDTSEQYGSIEEIAVNSRANRAESDRWPSPHEYNEAIQNPTLCFTDQQLKHGTVVLDQLGLPRPESGAFASVYRVKCSAGDVAVKCFLTRYDGQAERYREISRFLSNTPISACVSFRYLQDGITVNRCSYPLLQMDWIEGTQLLDYINENLQNPGALEDLNAKFEQLARELHNAGIAHGDLQHANIIVQGGRLKLVDYDGMFVPALAGFGSNENGHPNYQHPRRDGSHFGPYLDHFSIAVIQLSLMALAIDYSLLSIVGGGDEYILLNRKDYSNPENSSTFNLLLNHSSHTIREKTKDTRRLLAMTPDRIPFPLDSCQASA